ATGAPKRTPPSAFAGAPPPTTTGAIAFARRVLVVGGAPYQSDRDQAARLAKAPALADWPLVVLVDDAKEAARSAERLLWTCFTRMEPAADLHGRDRTTARFPTGLTPPARIPAP